MYWYFWTNKFVCSLCYCLLREECKDYHKFIKQDCSQIKYCDISGESDFCLYNVELRGNSWLFLSLQISSDNCLLPAQSFGLESINSDGIRTIMNANEYTSGLIFTTKYYNLK